MWYFCWDPETKNVLIAENIRTVVSIENEDAPGSLDLMTFTTHSFLWVKKPWNVYGRDSPTADSATAVPCWLVMQVNIQNVSVCLLFNLSKYLCPTVPDPSWFKSLMPTQSQQWAATCLPSGDGENLCRGEISPVARLEPAAHKRSLETCDKTALLLHPDGRKAPGRDQNESLVVLRTH